MTAKAIRDEPVDVEEEFDVVDEVEGRNDDAAVAEAESRQCNAVRSPSANA